MVKFNEVAPEEFPNTRYGRRGRVSYPILKAFMETNFKIAEVDRNSVEQRPENLYASLRAYAIKHKIPVKPINRQGKLYLIRLDMDDEGNVDPNWVPEEDKKNLSDEFIDDFEEEDVAPVNAGEVKTRLENFGVES